MIKLLFLATGCLFSVSSLAEEVWLDGTKEYHFSDNGEFQYIARHSERSTTEANKDCERIKELGIECKANTKPGDAQIVYEGVFEYQHGICWAGEKEKPLHTGNTIIYSGSGQCCLAGRYIADKLVFEKIWYKSDDSAKAPDYCKNGVLQPDPEKE